MVPLLSARLPNDKKVCDPAFALDPTAKDSPLLTKVSVSPLTPATVNAEAEKVLVVSYVLAVDKKAVAGVIV